MSSPFDIDVRDVVQRMKDKSYGSLGEAFEDYFYEFIDDLREFTPTLFDELADMLPLTAKPSDL